MATLGPLGTFGQSRHFWALLGTFEHPWALWHSGPNGHYGYSVYFRALWALSGLWAPRALLGTLGTFGPFWALWAPLGTFGIFGLFWALWALWALLGTFGHYGHF